jgi:cellobiose phosphorylase
MQSNLLNPKNILRNSSNLNIEILSNGGIRKIYKDDFMINLFLGNEMEGGVTNIYLRVLNGSIKFKPLLGAGSDSSFLVENNVFTVRGRFEGLEYILLLNLAEEKNYWFWNVEVINTSQDSILFDLIYCQDIGIAHYSAIRQNEYFVSQYIDHQPLYHEDYGYIIASRQNQSYDRKNPGIYLGSFNKSISYATDASQIYGINFKSDGKIKSLQEGLPGFRMQHEHSMVAIQDEINKLFPKQVLRLGFFGSFVNHKEKASSLKDLEFVNNSFFELNPFSQIKNLKEFIGQFKNPFQVCSPSYFSSSNKLDGNQMKEEELKQLFHHEWRQLERDNEGNLLSFFTNSYSHIVMRKKEELVLRPHGIILQTNKNLFPDESCMASTLWMNGNFHSMVTQGHASLNCLISHSHSYLGLFNSHGLRIFAEFNGSWSMLRNPSFFEMELNQCRWYYKLEAHTIEVVSSTNNNANSLSLSIKVKSGSPLRFLLSVHLGFDGDNGSNISLVKIENLNNKIFLNAEKSTLIAQRFNEQVMAIHLLNQGIWEKIGQDELLFADGLSRKQSYFTGIVSSSNQVDLEIIGLLVEPDSSAILPEDRIELPNIFFPNSSILQNEFAYNFRNLTLVQAKCVNPFFKSKRT